MAAGLILFGVAFGYVEAAVVVYLRTIYNPVQRQIRPDRPAGDLFPMLTQEQLRATAPETFQLAGMEVLREAATLVMLAAVALCATGVDGSQPLLSLSERGTCFITCF